jgi:hypothetical protein
MQRQVLVVNAKTAVKRDLVRPLVIDHRARQLILAFRHRPSRAFGDDATAAKSRTKRQRA